MKKSKDLLGMEFNNLQKGTTDVFSFFNYLRVL